MLVFIFGPCGTGKNYVGEVLKNNFNFIFWDADEAIPLDMKQCVIRQEFPSPALRAVYTKKIIESINQLQAQNPGRNICIAQALYTNNMRNEIREAFPDMQFIELTSKLELELARVKERSHLVSLAYAEHNFSGYEQALFPRLTLDNSKDGSNYIIEQLLLMPQIAPFYQCAR